MIFLYTKGVITMEEKLKMDHFSLNIDKMQFLLDEIIVPSLQVGVIVKFQAFLNVMEQSHDPLLFNMAKKLSM